MAFSTYSIPYPSTGQYPGQSGQYPATTYSNYYPGSYPGSYPSGGTQGGQFQYPGPQTGQPLAPLPGTGAGSR
jgi:hypothetical protein